MAQPNSLLEVQIREQLLKCGWSSDGILYGKSIFANQGSYSQVRFTPDILLLYNLYPLAVVEVKGLNIAPNPAVSQVSEYAEAIGVPFAYVTKGTSISEVNAPSDDYKFRERFPKPSDLWSLLNRDWNQNDPRLYPPYPSEEQSVKLHQALAVSRTVEAVINGSKRVLVSMAQGAGVSYVVFQIAWKLIQSGYYRRMLYLSDTLAVLMSNKQVFDPFGPELLVLSRPEPPHEVHRVQMSSLKYFVSPKSSPNFLAIAQDYYDLILLQGIHELKRWMPVLEHFQSATQIGFTNTTSVDSEPLKYFGRPVFTFSLQEVLQMEEIRPPEGFEEVRLDQIAEISAGILVKDGRKMVSGERKSTGALTSSEIYYVTGADIQDDGSLLLDALQKIDRQSFVKTIAKDAISDKRFLQKNDILVASYATGVKNRVAIIPHTLIGQVTFAHSLIRVRVDPELADPKDVFIFLQSDTGQIAIRSILRGTNIPRLSFNSVGQIRVFLPQSRSTRATTDKLNITSSAIRQLKEEILPALEKIEQRSDQREIEEILPALEKTEQRSDQREINVEDLELIAGKLQYLASILSPPSLAERVMSRYPTLIALAYRRFFEARFNVYEQVLRLKDLFEATSFFIYNLVLADTLRRLDSSQYYIKDKGARRAYNGYSMSARMDFVAAVLDISNSNGGRDLFMPELVSTPVISLAKRLQDDLRNQISHTATATESQQRNVLMEFQPLVEELLAKLEFLSNYQLVRIPSFYFKRGQLFCRMEIYQGVTPSLNERIVERGMEPIHAEHDHIVLLNVEEQVLDLYPFYQLLATKETRYESHLCFFKQRKAGDKRLEGESAQGAFPIELEGFNDFESLQTKILEEPN